MHTCFMFRKQLRILLLLIFVVLFLSHAGYVHAEKRWDKHSSKITAAILNDFPPLYLLDKSRNPSGIAIDILQHVSAQANLKVDYLIVNNWAEAMQAVRSGKADLIPGIGISPTRMKEFSFTEETETIPVSCFVRQKNFSIKGIDSLPGKKVTVIAQSAAETRLRPQGNIDLVLSDDIACGLMLLLAGSVDAFVFPEPVLFKKAKTAGVEGKIKVVGKPLMELKRGFLLRKADTELLNILNPIIKEHTQSPEYLKNYAKWYGEPIPFWNVKKIFGIMSGVLIVSVLVLMLWRNHSITKINRQLFISIEEQQKSEEALRESEKKYRRLFSSTSDAIIVFDPKTLQIEDANQTTFDLYGYSKEEFLKLKITDISAEPDKTLKTIQRIQDKDPKATRIPLRYFKRNDGGHFPGEVSIGFFEVNGHEKIISSVRDISQRIKMEEGIRQGQKMEAIGTLAGGIAHDFNNILAAILGYADMVRDDVSKKSPQYFMLDGILKAGNRAKELVGQILAFSRQQEVDRIPIQPQSIVNEVIKLLRPSLPATIEIRCKIDPECGIINADPTQIHQVLMNLCTNAFHALEDTGGILEVNLKRVELRPNDIINETDMPLGSYVKLSVRDDGPGIDPSKIDKIFEPYYTTKEQGKGTGMGLAVVHGIVRSHEGIIQVNSEVGQGTTFQVFFPIVEETVKFEPKAVETLSVGNEKILFVDDEKLLTDLGKNMLEKLGYAVRTKNNGRDAIELFQSQPDQFDLVITDQTMPGMTGVDLSKRLLEIRSDIPIILCTGFSNIISEEKAKAIGIKAFTMKPLARQDFAKLVRTVLDAS